MRCVRKGSSRPWACAQALSGEREARLGWQRVVENRASFGVGGAYPQSPKPPGGPSFASVEEPRSLSQRPRVLIVDDDDGILKLLSGYLGPRGFLVKSASSLSAAREELAKELPEVLLLDYQLPDGFGTDLLLELGAGAEQCAVVMITGVAKEDVSIATQAMLLGAMDYLTKPFSLAELESKIASCLLEREARLRRKEELSAKRAFSQHILAVVEQERKHLAAELHDEIGQYLTTLKIEAELLARDHRGPVDQKERLLKLCRGLREAIQKLRDIAHGLRPAVLDSLGLEAALSRLLEECEGPDSPGIRFFHKGLGERLPQDMELGIYRIVQEALTNSLKHAQARNIMVNLVRTKDRVSVSIEDDGVGFEPDPNAKAKGLGLLMMKERAESLGGSLWVETAPRKGTCISAELPLEKPGRS